MQSRLEFQMGNIMWREGKLWLRLTLFLEALLGYTLVCKNNS